MWIIVVILCFYTRKKKEPLRMCAVWKWHLLYLIILQASAVTKVLWFLFSLQRLRLIEIYDVKRLQLRYATSLIGWGSRDHCFSWFSLFESAFESILSDTFNTLLLIYINHSAQLHRVVRCHWSFSYLSLQRSINISHFCCCLCTLWTNLPWYIWQREGNLYSILPSTSW